MLQMKRLLAKDRAQAAIDIERRAGRAAGLCDHGGIGGLAASGKILTLARDQRRFVDERKSIAQVVEETGPRRARRGGRMRARLPKRAAGWRGVIPGGNGARTDRRVHGSPGRRTSETPTDCGEPRDDSHTRAAGQRTTGLCSWIRFLELRRRDYVGKRHVPGRNSARRRPNAEKARGGNGAAVTELQPARVRAREPGSAGAARVRRRGDVGQLVRRQG